MNDESAGTLRRGRTVAEVLLAMGRLMEECHRKSLELQEAISLSLPVDGTDPSRLETYQHLDHVTQMYEDLGRLLPRLSRALRTDAASIDDLAATLRLHSLRERLFDAAAAGHEPRHFSGEVSFF